MSRFMGLLLPMLLTISVAACTDTPEPKPAAVQSERIGRIDPLPDELYGTLEPFAAEAVYFVATDRFVDGDPSNNHEDQGPPEWKTFDRPIQREGLPPANIGYLGGDFKGVLNNAAYIADLGFTAIWMTPIVDNPDEAFSGGAGGNDLGKTGYHGYWGVNFFELDEHLPSPGLDYAALTRSLRDEHGLKTVLDVVCNHGTPSYTMPADQPKYGEVYDADGTLIADHQNLHPSELDSGNPLHQFFRHEPDLAELGDFDFDNPAVLDYCIDATRQWLEQGAAAIRIDTIRHMPHRFWKQYGDRLRDEYPGLFMFGEAFIFDANALAEFTYPQNGGNSVLDFPGREAMLEVFGSAEAPYSRLQSYLHIDSGLYQNPYELMTFYDNHDMSRIDADQQGFIDANNWLFTSRGIPVVYYGSEIAFRAGLPEHGGNRDYFGQDNVELAKSHPIHGALKAIAGLRKNSIALQRGLQLNVTFDDDSAVFWRIFQHDGVNESMLVLLNKADRAATLRVDQWPSVGHWQDAMTGKVYTIGSEIAALDLNVPAHGVMVLRSGKPVTNGNMLGELSSLQRHRNP